MGYQKIFTLQPTSALLVERQWVCGLTTAALNIIALLNTVNIRFQVSLITIALFRLSGKKGRLFFHQGRIQGGHWGLETPSRNISEKPKE